MFAASTEGAEEMGLLPPKEKPKKDVGRSVYAPEDLWERYDRIAAETVEDDPEGKGYSRNEVIKHAMQKFADDWDRERASKNKRTK